jgi:hypothetical protein
MSGEKWTATEAQPGNSLARRSREIEMSGRVQVHPRYKETVRTEEQARMALLLFFFRHRWNDTCVPRGNEFKIDVA